MSIQCRTGCGAQLNYDHIPFPDGFIYFLPKNLDGTIHNCSNLPKEEIIRGWSPEEVELDRLRYLPRKEFEENYERNDNLIRNGPNRLHAEYETIQSEYFNEVIENDQLPENQRKPELLLLKKRLLNVQMRCILFPTPLLIDTGDIVTSDIIDLSNCYEELCDYESAITARIIQDGITHDQGKKLVELERLKNKKPLNEETNTNKSVIEIRDKDIRQLEGAVKEFLRKNFSIKDFKELDPELFLQLNEHREERNRVRTNTIGKFDDVFERLTLGQCLTIIRKQKKKEKKNNEISKLSKIESEYLSRLDWLVANFRNENDHSVDDVEKEFSEDDKILSIIYAKSITDFLDKLAYI